MCIFFKKMQKVTDRFFSVAAGWQKKLRPPTLRKHRGVDTVSDLTKFHDKSAKKCDIK